MNGWMDWQMNWQWSKPGVLTLLNLCIPCVPLELFAYPNSINIINGRTTCTIICIPMELFSYSSGLKAQISTRVHCFWIKTNQANWTLFKTYPKEPIFSATNTYVRRLLIGHEPIFWFAFTTDQLLICLLQKQSTLVEICVLKYPGWETLV